LNENPDLINICNRYGIKSRGPNREVPIANSREGISRKPQDPMNSLPSKLLNSYLSQWGGVKVYVRS
jgi:hypothetical protein